MFGPHRCRYIAALITLVACHPRRAAQPLAAANPGATFEVHLTGCSNTEAAGRRFGHDVRAALLWSSERVHTASYFPCTATMDAVRGTDRHTIYRITRGRDGSYREELVRDTWRPDSTRR